MKLIEIEFNEGNIYALVNDVKFVKIIANPTRFHDDCFLDKDYSGYYPNVIKEVTEETNPEYFL